MRASSRAVVVGDTTGGGSGNPLARELPNGWIYQMSQWIQYDLNHTIIEDRGVIPDITVLSREQDRVLRRDRVIEAAVAALRARGG